MVRIDHTPEYEVFLVSTSNIDTLAKDAKGDVRMRLALKLLAQAVADMRARAGTNEAAQCLCLGCDTTFVRGPPEVFVVVLSAERPEPGENLGLVAGICAKCRERGDPRPAIAAALEVLLDPDNDRGDATLH